MTRLLYAADADAAYLRRAEGRVVEVDAEARAVVLDATVFYATSGGQPHDTGTLSWEGGSARVVEVRGPRHTLDGPLPPVGALVGQEIDWDRRYTLMRTHSALHILCGVVFRDYGALVTGGNMEPGEARMDFELAQWEPQQFSREVERKVGEEVAADRAITVRHLARAEAFQIPDLIRTKINLLPEAIEMIRVVDIEGLDMQADGGTHVRSTGEVGTVKVVKAESKGKANKRLRISVAPLGQP